MKRKSGLLFILLGCGLIAAALALFLSNRQEQIQAASASQEVIEKVVEAIREQKLEQTEPTVPPATDPAGVILPTIPQKRTMKVVDIDGYGYIGFLGIPSLELELPVMADWTYPQLQIAPCRYTGSIFTNNLVIMAHNYPQHFGRLKDMHTDDLVTFTDMDGNTIEYRVVALEILDSTAVEEVVSGSYDLTLFTCTYGGENRVVLRCDRVR